MAFLADFHTHFFSRTLFQSLAGASPLPGTPESRLERVTRDLGIALPSADPQEHLARWLDEMDRHGVSHIVSFASVAEEIPVLEDAARHAQGKMTAFVVCDPRRPEAARGLATLLGQGVVRGALFFPALQRFDLDGPEASAVFEALADARAIAVVHCGLLRMPLQERLGLPRDLDLARANPLALIRPAERFPGLTFVIPHFGSGFFRETLMAGAQCENIYVDTSSSQAWLSTQPERLTLADVFERALGVFGPDRILFGTDSSTFPRGWRRDILLAQREALGACGVREENRARILGMNAARLLRISP